MSDPLSITASVITVAGLAYNSVKTLHDFCTGIRDAPRTIQETNVDLNEISKVLLSFGDELNRASELAMSPASALTIVKPQHWSGNYYQLGIGFKLPLTACSSNSP